MVTTVKSRIAKCASIGALAFAAFGASTVGGVVSSADANSTSNHAKCEGSFVHSVPILNNEGTSTQYGDLKLYYEGSGWMCAMAVARGAYYGESKYMKVTITDGYTTTTNQGYFSYYAGGARVDANGRRVKLQGWIQSPFSGRWAYNWFAI